MATHNKQPVMIRAISLLVAMVFAVTTLVGSPSEAQAAAGAFEFFSGKNGMTQLRQGLNAIPSEWGTVNAIWEPAEKKPGSPFIVHMQDAHSNPEAAQNIASILNYLSEKHPEMVIGLEGASGALHPEYLNFFSDYPEANLAVINDLKQKGELNGADLFLLGKGRPSGREIQVGNISLEYGSLSSVKPSEVRGVETAELYLEDLRIFRDLLSKQDEMQVLLNPIRSRLEKESSQKLNGELRDFLKERSRRKEGRFGLNMQTGLSMTPARSRGLAAPSAQADPNLLAYANYLCKQVLKFLGIDLSDSIEQLRFPNLMRVQRIAEAQQKFDTEKIQAEWTEVLKVLTALAKDTGEQDFFAALATFAREQGFIDEAAGREFSYPVERALYPRKLLEGLFLFKQKHPIDLARYGAFLKSWDLVALHAEIEVTELLKEMSALEDQLILVLAKTDEEKELVRQVTQLDLLEKLLKLELSRSEYDGVIASREAIEALAKDQGSLAPLLEQAFLFYEVSLKRDNALVENLLALTRGDRGTGNVPRVLVLYTGGFHSAGIEEILRSKGIGYAEIAPKTRSVDRGELYQKVMAGDNADLTAYFKVKNPFSTKQEAIFFKELVEIGAPALFEKYQLKPDQIASSVRQAIDAHPVLSKVVMAERPSGQHEGSSVTFQTRPSASVQSANSAAMPPDLLGSGLPVSTGGTRLEARTTVEFSTPPAFHTEIRPEFAHPMPLRNESAQVPSQRRAEIRITQEALRGILQGKPEDVALAMLGLYEDGSLLAPEYSLIFSEFGIDPSKFDLGIEAAGDMIIRRELKTKNLKLYRGGSETNVYRGTVNGNDILVKEIRLDSAVADSVWENHVANQEKLGGLVANYTTIKDLEVMVEGEMHTIHYAIVQEFATPLLDRVAKIQDEKENVEDKTEEIEALMKTYLDLYPEFLRRGFVPKPNGFLLDMGRTEEGRIVALDIGDLLPAESPDGVRLLKIIQHPNKFWDLLLAESFMSYFIPGNGDEVAQTAKDPLMSGRGGGPRPGVSVFKKEGTFLSKHTAGYSLLVSPSDMFSWGGQKDPKTYAFSERVRQGIFPAGIRESLNTNASVHRTTYLGNVNIREAIRSARLKYVRSFLRTREMSGIIEPDGFKLVLVDPKDIEPNAVLEGNPTGMGMTEGEIVYFDPAQKRIDRSIVRPHDSVEDQRMKLDNEIAAFRKALQTIDGQIEPETRALWGNFQSEVEEAIRIKKERGEYAVGALILRERQKIERMIHPLEAQNLREALFVLEKSLLPLLEDREALTYLSFEGSHSSEELSKRLVEHEDRRAVIKVLQILLKLPYGFSAPSETAQKDERTWAAGVQFAVGELVGDMRSMIRQNRSAKRAAKVMISSDHKIAKQIQVNKEKLKAKPNDKTANRNLTTYEALKEIFETVQQDLSEYDYVFNETDTPEARTGKIGDNLLVHQAVEKAVFARTAFQLTPEMKLRFDSHMMKEISKGRTLQYAVAAFLYTSFVEENMMVFFDQQLMNYLMAYYHFSVFGKTEQTPDKNIIVVASSIRNETEYASLLREAGIYGKVVAIGTLEVGYEVSGKNRFPHWYIFARQSGIVPIFPMHPVVPKSREIKISNGGWAMVDGQRGQIMQNPDKKTAEDWRKRGEGYRHMKQFFENRAALPAAFNNKPFFYRYDAVNPSLFRPQPGGAIATRLGGKGIGLYRMEAQLSDSKNPGAEENEEFISAPIKDILGQDYFSVPENALIVRLYDVQDDKRPGMLRESRDYQEIEAILAEHSNVRFYIYSDEELAKSPGLAQFREFGKHQLRALFDTKRTHPDRILKILFSNVRESREIDEIEKLVREAREDYLRQIPEEEKIRVATLLETVPLGYMIEETETADRLDSIFEKIKEVSAPKNKDAAPFIAIGSNDLVKSILNQHQTKFGSEWNLSNIHPQFAADLYRIGNLAKKYGFNVNLEGEWASSRRVLLLLLALHHFYGLDNVIPVAEPSDVPKLLEYVRNTTPDDLEKGGWLRASFQKILKKVIAGDETIPSLTLNRALYELQHKIEQRIFQREDFKAFKAAAEAGTWKIRSEMRRIEETGAMAGLMGVAASARSLQRSEVRESDVEAILQLPVDLTAYKGERSVAAGNATEDILRKESLSLEILKHVFGGEPNQRLEVFQKNSLVEAWQKLERDIKKYDLDRVMAGIEIMDPASVRDEGNIMTGQTAVAAVPVTLTLALSDLRSDMAHDARSVKITETTSGHPAFIHSITVGGVERSMFEMAIEGVLSQKASVPNAVRSEFEKEIAETGDGASLGRLAAREEHPGEITWQTNEGKSIRFNATRVVDESKGVKRIILWQSGKSAQDEFVVPDLMAYSINDTLRGVYIAPSNSDVAARGLLRPLLEFFFEQFPEVQSTYENMCNLAVTKILSEEYGFVADPRFPAPREVWMLKGQSGEKIRLFFGDKDNKDAKDNEKFFKDYLPPTMLSSYEFVAAKNDNFTRLEFGVPFVRPRGVTVTRKQDRDARASEKKETDKAVIGNALNYSFQDYFYNHLNVVGTGSYLLSFSKQQKPSLLPIINTSANKMMTLLDHLESEKAWIVQRHGTKFIWLGEAGYGEDEIKIPVEGTVWREFKAELHLDEYFSGMRDKVKLMLEKIGGSDPSTAELYEVFSASDAMLATLKEIRQKISTPGQAVATSPKDLRSEARQEEVLPEVMDKIVIRKSLDFSLDHYIRSVLFNLKGGASFLLESRGIRDSSMFPSMKVAADALMERLQKLGYAKVQIIQEKGRFAIWLGDNGWGPDAKRQWVKNEAWQDFKAKLGLEKDFLSMRKKAEEIQRILKNSRRTESDLSAVIAASDAILAIIDAMREKSISVDLSEAGKPEGLSVPDAREFTHRERLINLLQHDLSGKLYVLLNAEDAADISRDRLKKSLNETLREARVFFRLFDLGEFKGREGELFIPEGHEDVFAYSIRSSRSPTKIYKTPVFGDMPRKQTFDDKALRRIAGEVGFDKIRALFSGDVKELEQLRDEISKREELTLELRSRVKGLAEKIHGKMELLVSQLTAEPVPVTAAPSRVIKKVLLVDDEALLRKVLVMQLKGFGYEVGSAANGREALQQLQTGNFDLVITDVTMPLMGGIELAENMRTGGINLPVIFMSGATSWKSSRGSWIKIDDLKKREPYADFLQKPFMASNMEAAIQKISSRSEARVEKVTDEAVIGNALDFALRSHNIPNALNIIESEAYSWERRGRDSAFLELIDAIAWEMKTMLEKLKAPNVQIVRNKEFQAIFLGNVGWGSNPDTVDVDSEAWAKYKTKLDLGKDIVRMQEKADLIRGIIGNLTPEATNLSPVKEASQSIRAIVEEIHQKIFPSDQAAANKPVALFRPSPRPTMPVDRVESISSKTPKVEDVDQLKRELARDLQRNILKETLGSSTEFVAKLIASWRWKTPGKAESVAVDVKEFRGSLDRLTSDQLRNLATAVMNNKQPPSYGSYELSGLNSRLSEWETNKLGNIFSWQETAREKARLADARGDFEDRNRYDLAAVIKADDWAKIKNILASAYAKDLVLPRSEVRMSNTDDYKRELEQNTTPTAELSVQSEMLGAINSTAKQLGFYSEQGIASYASGWSSVQIRSWIASQLLAPLRMMATEQKISNEKLKTILDGIKQFVANGAAEKPDLLGQGPALHVRLPQLSEAQWQAFLKDVPVLLGALVSFRANIYFNVHADSKRAAEMETELRQTVRAEGVELADRQVRFFSIPEGSGFASLKTGKVDARLSEEVRYLQLGSKLGTAWKGSEESKVDMRTLAAEITTVLYAILDEKVNADWNRIHAPEQYSSELFRAVLGALEAYESIKQAA